MNTKLVNKYIPKQFRNVNITTSSGGMHNATSMFKHGGVSSPKHKLHIEPLRGSYQGYSSHPEIHQVILPNDDRLMVGYCYNRELQNAAFAHISAKTGLATLLATPHSSSYFNKSLSEVFSTWVRHNETNYPFASRRIGDYAAFEGLQFKYDGENGDIEALNPRPDYRIATNRKVSMAVRKEMREVAGVMNTKADMLRSVWGSVYTWATNPVIKESLLELNCPEPFVDKILSEHRAIPWRNNPFWLLDTKEAVAGNCKEGQVLSLEDKADTQGLYDAVNGSVSHGLLALILATGNSRDERDLLNLAPIFIAARGGYSLTRIEK